MASVAGVGGEMASQSARVWRVWRAHRVRTRCGSTASVASAGSDEGSMRRGRKRVWGVLQRIALLASSCQLWRPPGGRASEEREWC